MQERGFHSSHFEEEAGAGTAQYNQGHNFNGLGKEMTGKNKAIEEEERL